MDIYRLDTRNNYIVNFDSCQDFGHCRRGKFELVSPNRRYRRYCRDEYRYRSSQHIRVFVRYVFRQKTYLLRHGIFSRQNQI